MTPEQFAYWLQGFAELRVGDAAPSDWQWKAIVEHLKTVFNKVTPPVAAAPTVLPKVVPADLWPPAHQWLTSQPVLTDLKITC